MVVRGHPSLSLTRQCGAVDRAFVALLPAEGESAETLALMRRIDELFLKYPFYGARQMVRHLRREGGADRAAPGRSPDAPAGSSGGLSGAADQRAAPRAPGLSVSAAGSGDRAAGPCVVRRHHLHPGAARLPLPGGGHGLGEPPCAGLAAVEHAGRGVLHGGSGGSSARHGAPEIFNTDQGSQFTGFAFTARLREAGIRISMDGRGRCMDNIFIERLWRSLKYEAVYLHEIADGFAARRVIGDWIGFYNTERPHSALGGRTPAEAYRDDTPVDMMDKPLRALPTYPQAQQQQQERKIQEDSGGLNFNRNSP